jgi:hypothetical protein
MRDECGASPVVERDVTDLDLCLTAGLPYGPSTTTINCC